MAVILNGCESILQYLREKPGLVSHRNRRTRFSLCKGSTVSKRHEQISRSEAGRPSPSVEPSVLVVGSSAPSRASKWTGASERAPIKVKRNSRFDRKSSQVSKRYAERLLDDTPRDHRTTQVRDACPSCAEGNYSALSTKQVETNEIT
eukprot:904609_1